MKRFVWIAIFLLIASSAYGVRGTRSPTPTGDVVINEGDITNNYTTKVGIDMVKVNCDAANPPDGDGTGSDITVTLSPAADEDGSTKTIVKTDSSANVVTVDANGPETIGSALTYRLTFQHDFISITSDGSNWQIVGDSGSEINVKWFGATGDGSTDDASAIQAATDVADASGGGTVLFPRGTYLAGATLTYYSSIVFKGVGTWASIIQADTGVTTLFESATPASRLYRIQFNKLRLHGDSNNTIAIDFQNVSNSKVLDVDFNTCSSAVKLQGQSYFNQIQDVMVTNCTYGVHITTDGSNSANANVITAGKVYRAYKGVWIEDGHQNNIAFMDFEQCGIGIDVDDQANMITQIRVEGLDADPSSTNTTFTSTRVTDASAWDLATVEARDVGWIITDGTNRGIATGASDSGDYIDVGSWSPAQPSDGTKVYVTTIGVDIASGATETGVFGGYMSGTYGASYHVVDNSDASTIIMPYGYRNKVVANYREWQAMSFDRKYSSGDSDWNSVVKVGDSSGTSSIRVLEAFADDSAAKNAQVIVVTDESGNVKNSLNPDAYFQGDVGVRYHGPVAATALLGGYTFRVGDADYDSEAIGGMYMYEDRDSGPGWINNGGREYTRLDFKVASPVGGGVWQEYTVLSLKSGAYAGGDVVVTNDIQASGGFKQVFQFMQSDVAANQTDVQINCLGLAGNTEYVMAYAGSVIAISIASNAARTAGEITNVEPTINGTGTGLVCELDDSPTQYNQATQAKDTDAFSAGDRLGVEITTDGSWAPTTADIVVTVIVEM